MLVERRKSGENSASVFGVARAQANDLEKLDDRPVGRSPTKNTSSRQSHFQVLKVKHLFFESAQFL